MSNTIKIKRNSSGTPSSLEAGELAVNTTNGNLYCGNTAGNGVLNLNPFVTLGDTLYYSQDAEKQVADDSTNSNYHTMREFYCDKSGSFRIKFSAFIASGSYYWRYRIYNETTSSEIATAFFNSSTSGNGLDTGQSASVHAYRRYRIDVGADKAKAGDKILIQMVSASGGGAAIAGNGQNLVLKEFRVYLDRQYATPIINSNAGTYSNGFDTTNGQFVGKIRNTGTQSEDNGLLIETATSNASSNILKVQSDGDANIFIVKGNGNIGIGLSSGAINAPLHVNGSPIFEGNGSFGGSNATSAKLFVRGGYSDFWHSTNNLLRVSHDGTKAKLQSFTGGAYDAIALNPDGGSVLVKGADNNGGTADFSVATGGGTPQISWRSNGQVQIGSNDMNWNSKIFYDGATRFYTWANDIVLSAGHQGSGSTGAYDIALYAATSHHTPAEYLRCDGSAGQTVLSKPLQANNIITVGSNGNGHDVRFWADNGKFFEWDESMELTRANDGVKSVWGSGDDLQIYHDGSHSRINNATGNLNIQANDFHLTDSSNTAVSFIVDHDGATGLYFNQSARLTTTATGVTISTDLIVNDASGLASIKLTGGASGADNFQLMQGVTGVTNAGFSIYDIDATATRFVIDSSGNTTLGGNVFPASDAAKDLGAYNIRWLSVFATRFRAGDGNAGNPGITFINDLNTGLYRSANDTMHLVTGGVSQIAVSNTGVEINGNLTLDNSHLNLDHGYSLQWADSHERIEATNSTLKFFTNNGQQMTLSGSNLGIGETDPVGGLVVRTDDVDATASANASQYSLNIHGNGVSDGEEIGLALTAWASGGSLTTGYTPGAAIVHERTGGNSKGHLHFRVKGSTTANAPLTTAMTILDSGNVGIGQPVPIKPLHIKAASPYTVYEDTDDNKIWLTGGGAGKYNIYEDVSGTHTLRLSIGSGGTVTVNNNLTVSGSCTFAALSGTTAGFSGTLTVNKSVGNGQPTDSSSSIYLNDQSSLAAGIGGSIVFGGRYSTNNFLGGGPYIRGVKINAQSTDYSFGLAFGVRKNGVNSSTEVARFDEEGQLALNNTTYIRTPNNTGLASALIWRRLDNSIVGRIVADTTNLRTQFWDNNSAVLTIAQDQISIGTTVPTQTLHIAANGSGSTAVDNHGYGLRVQDTNHAHGAIDILQNGDTATFVSRSNVQGGYEFKSYASVGTATHVRLKIKQNGETHIGSDAQGVAIHGNTSGLGSIIGVSRDGSAYKGLEVNASPVYLKHAGATRLTTTNDGVFVSGSVTRTHKRGLYLNNNYPLNYSSEGETVWSINPQWSDTELQSFFNSTNVNFQNDSTAPAGYSVYIAGNVNVGATYGSPFPMIPVEPDTIIYCECWVKDAGAVGHYMGSIEYKEDFGQPSTGSGNPGSYGYWVMINTSPGTSGWTKVHGYLGPNTGSSTGQWETGTKYFTPQALFNYTHSSGTRGTYISGWKYIRVSQAGKRTFSDPIGVNTTADSQDALSIKSTGDGRNALSIKDNAGDAMFNVRQSSNDCLIRAYKDGGTQTLQFHSDGESYIKGGSGGNTDLSLGGPGVTSHGTLVLNNSGGSAIGKVRCEGGDDSFYVSKLAGGGAFNITSNNDIVINSTDNVSIGASDLSSYAESPYANNLIVGKYATDSTGHNGMTIVSGPSHIGSIYFSDGTNGNQRYRGYIQYEHGNERYSIGVGAASRLWVDTDGLKFAANHYIRNSSGLKQIRFKANEVCFNEDGRDDVDVRMEGDTDTNLFILDASVDRIGIGAYPSNKFHVTQAADISPSAGGAGQFAVTGNGYTTFLAMNGTAAYFGHNSSGRALTFMTNETNRLSISGSGPITFNNAYTFPTAIGSANQVLAVGGGGTLSWVDQSGGGSGSGTVSETHAAQTNHEVAVHLGGNEVGEAHRLWYNYNSGTSGLTVNAASPETGSTYSLYVGGGIKSTTGGLHITGDGYISSRLGVATLVDTSYGIKVAGYIASYGHTTWSDQRLKDDTSLWDTSEAASLVKGVPVYSYKWSDKCDAKKIQTQDRIGFLAHEVEEKINKNDLVVTSTHVDRYKSVNQTDMIPILWAALQDALKRIEDLENK